MSMNLCFVTKSGHIVEFPYQTTTELTYAVLDEPSVEGKLSLIEKDMKNWVEEVDDDGEWVKETLSKIESMLKDEHLELTYT